MDIGSVHLVSVFTGLYQLNLGENTILQKFNSLQLEHQSFLFQQSQARLPNRGCICLGFPQHVIVIHIWRAYKTLHQSEMWWRPFLVNRFICLLFNSHLCFLQPHEIMWFWSPSSIHVHKKMWAKSLSQRENAHGISTALMCKLK